MISVGDQRYMLSFLFPQLTTRADSIYSKLASEESDDVSVSSAVESDDKSRESDDESDSYVSDESDPSSLVQAVRGRKIFCVYGKNSSLIRNRYV